jgi:uncharacterized protein
LNGANNGVVLLVAPNERKVWITVGYGLEGTLTDAYSSVIVSSKILPAFKAGDMPGGIDAGADAIIELLSLPDDQARAKENAAVAEWDKRHKRSHNDGVPGALIFWLIVIAWIVFAGFFRRARYGQRYGGSSWPIWLWAADSLLNSRDGGGWSSSGSSSSDSGGGGGWGDGGFTGGGGGSFGGGGAGGSW